MSLREQALPALGSILAGLSITLFMGMLHEKRPNVVVIVVDTLRADAISTKPGNRKTPNIAELAAGGSVFTKAFAHAPMTLPSHASLFSGRHPYETGIYNNGDGVPDDLPLMAETLLANGYQTAAVVSLATLWPQGRRQGLDRGFEIFDPGRTEISTAEDTTERLIRALDAFDPDRPFFLFAHLSDPHEPYNEHRPWFDGPSQGHKAEILLDGQLLDSVETSSMSWWEREVELTPGPHRLTMRSRAPFKLRSFEVAGDAGSLDPSYLKGACMEPGRELVLELSNASDGPQRVGLRAWLNDVPATKAIQQRYASEVSAADEAIGRLVRELRERGLWDDTLVILTSDHGEALGEHGTIGHVVNLFDELIHVPLILRLPKDARDARFETTRNTLVRHIDVAPTVLDWLDLPQLDGCTGESLLRTADRLLMAETHPPEAPRALFAVRDSSYKLIFDPLEDSFEMYRLGPDPLELDNVYSHQGHLRKTWELVLRKLAKRVEPSLDRDEETQLRLQALGY